VNDDDSDLNEEKFATDLIGQIEEKVTKKLRKAGIVGVKVTVNRSDYTLDFSGSEDSIQQAKTLLEEERRRAREG
jgi:hypothetical protein